jgi:hypothetical protein
MCKDKLLGALKLKKIDTEEKPHAETKMERRKLTSSEEFLKGFDNLRKDGPLVKYQNPGSCKTIAANDDNLSSC